MAWNWQDPDWPNFVWTASALTQAEARFAEGAGVVIGAFKHLPDEDQARLRIEVLSLEAVNTAAIEGERLDRESVQSSILKGLGMAAARRSDPAEAGMAAVMVDLYQRLAAPLTEADLKAWHGLIMAGRQDMAAGVYRTHDDPMQIVSGAVYAPKVHFEAPPSAQVPTEMARFMSWLTDSAPGGRTPLPPMTRAGIAHLWFESVHPFEDGNGRVGRAIIEKVLGQGVTKPIKGAIITGMAGVLLTHRKAYNAALERASSALEISDWLIWFADRALEAQGATLRQIEFTLKKSRLMDRVRGRINDRQEKVLLRMFEAGPEGFKGGLSAANYLSITGTTTATTTRDLAELVEIGAVTRTGARKSTRYFLNLPQ